MNKKLLLLAGLLCVLLLAGCVGKATETKGATAQTNMTTTEAATQETSERETSENGDELMTPAAETTGSTTTATETTAAETSAAATETTMTETSASTAETSTESSSESSSNFYSSYAHLVDYDPASGLADFDYFNLLQGDEAVQWLVEREGYTQAEAEAEIAEYADSEFIEQNDNPLLRTIDLNDVTLKLMYHPDGTLVSDAVPIGATISDLNALYTMNPDAVFNTHFYYVTVNAGAVETVSQVYWP